MDEINPTVSKPSPLPLQFDEFCDIIGGQSWLQFIYHLKTHQQQHRINAVSSLKLALTGKSRFFCTGDMAERQELEIFYLKLTLLVHVAQIIKDAHRLLNSPLMNLTPGSIRIGVSQSQSLAPSIWNYRLAYDRYDPDHTPPYMNPNPTCADPTTNPQHDYYCLGMLIMRALLVNRTQPMNVVKKKIDELAKTITDIYNANKDTIGEKEIESKLIQLIDSFLNEDMFQQRNLIYKPHYHSSDLIYPPLWRGVLTIGLRLITFIPGYSYIDQYKSETEDCWEIARDIFDELSDCEHQAKRNIVFESINPSSNLHDLVLELTHQENWQAEYFDQNTQLKNTPSDDDLVEIDIFGLEEDLTPGRMVKAKSPKNRLTSENDSDVALEFFNSLIKD